MLTKDGLIKHLQALPEDVFKNIDTLFEQIIILDKIGSGIRDIDEGNAISHEDMKKVIDSWFQK